MIMNNVVRSSLERFEEEQSHIKGSMFSSICRGLNINHFTRKRKLSIEPLIQSILNRKGLTLSMEIRKFYRVFNPNEKNVISNVGYLKQRLKLNPEAFTYLNNLRIKNFYRDEKDSLLKLKGYFLFAVDGSKINIPNTLENQEIYGVNQNQNGQRAQAGFSSLFDVLNKMIIDCSISPVTYSERAEAEKHIKEVPTVIGDQPFIVTLDRGYPSSFLFMDLMDKNQKFVVRLSSKDFRKEQTTMQSDDEDVEIKFTPARINPYRKTPLADRLKERGSINLRFVKIKLPGNTVEVLATNLSRQEFSQDEISDIYRSRWGIETAYDILKNDFMLENFTGKKSIIIEQDILSTVYLYNVTTDMIRDAEKEQQKKNKNKKYKHRMKINNNIAIGIIKEDLIHMTLEDNPEKRSDIFRSIIESIAKNIVPIRENRQYTRKRSPSTKYPMTKKRSY